MKKYISSEIKDILQNNQDEEEAIDAAFCHYVCEGYTRWEVEQAIKKYNEK